MEAMFDQFNSSDAAAPTYGFAPPPRAERPAAADAPPGWEPSGSYVAHRLRPGTAAAILLLHAGLLFALVQFDVVPIHKKAPPPLVVTLVPEPVAPPPAPPEQKVQPVKKIEQQAVAPPPLVKVAAPPPVPVVTVPEPPPPQATVAAPAPASPAVDTAPVALPDVRLATLSTTPLRYPVESRRRHEEGTVRLRLIITADGAVKDVSVSRSSGFERLDKAALEAVRKWRFKARVRDGVAVEAIGLLDIPFNLAA